MRRTLIGVLSIALLGVTSFAVSQGSLTPPAGAPAANMKSLQEIHDATTLARRDAHRTPIFAADVPYLIATPGSYYLAENVNFAGDAAGIWITSPNVTLDLNGFTLAGPGKNTGGAGSAVRIEASNATVGNGHITGWPAGGVRAYTGSHSTVTDTRVSNVGYHGISVGNVARLVSCTVEGADTSGILAGDDAHVENCLAKMNNTSAAVTQAGIKVGSNSLVVQSRAISNTGFGIWLGNYSVADRCLARTNTDDGFNHSFGGEGVNYLHCISNQNLGDGFSFATHAIIQGCSATGNKEDGFYYNSTAGPAPRIADCYALRNELMGFRVNSANGGSIMNSVASENRYTGVYTGSGWAVKNNTARGNGVGTGVEDGVGIHVSSACHVSENHCTNNDVGIAGAGSYFSLNTLQGNTTNKSIAGSTEGAGDMANVIFP